MKDYESGVTAPPFHVRCRSTTVPYFDDDFGEIGERAARGKDGKTYYVPADMTYKEWKETFVDGDEDVANSDESGIIKSVVVSGALNPYSERAEKHAEQYYEAVRKMTTDYKHIAENTGYDEDVILSIKNFIFMDTHNLGGIIRRFDPNYEMGQSWQRLIDGKNIQKHDLTMLKHEITERQLMSEGYSQNEAHIITSRKYNYRKECDEYYGKINKYKQDRE